MSLECILDNWEDFQRWKRNPHPTRKRCSQIWCISYCVSYFLDKYLIDDLSDIVVDYFDDLNCYRFEVMTDICDTCDPTCHDPEAPRVILESDSGKWYHATKNTRGTIVITEIVHVYVWNLLPLVHVFMHKEISGAVTTDTEGRYDLMMIHGKSLSATC